MQEFELNNKIKSVYRQNKNTPRVGVNFNLSINEAEKYAGTYCLMSRLLLQGTKNRSSEQLAQELDENAIDFSCDMKQDYLRFHFVCLNEDFAHAVEIMSDVVKNPTFEEFDKEKIKMQGEITAELDSVKTKALDNYYKTIFEGHFYGNTYTKMLENLSKITKEDVENAYKEIIKTSKKVLSFVGDIDFDTVKDLTGKYLGDIENSQQTEKNIPVPILKQQKTVEIIKNDAQQAQIIQGWILPTFDNSDYPALILTNVILGSAGLSSRLFLELREKKGLAYTVRSSYETYEKCAGFSIYIATEPKNVQICLDGFKTEIEKLKETPVSTTELENAKNNFIGKQQFVTETNAQQANQLAYYGIMGLGFDNQKKIIEKIKMVTPEQIQSCANKYFGDKSVVSILRPEIN
ncbi:MAG: pitrilysin family protein [Candidatus Gastranaerophilaceae bacterium]